MEITAPPPWVIQIAGLAQVVLAVGSLSIPVVLRWKEQTAPLRPLIREVFWTYAAYICVSNLSFGLLSAFLPESLLDGTPLAAAVTGFLTCWWGGRLIIQFAFFDRSDAPSGPLFTLAEVGLVLLFISLTLIYAAAMLTNLGIYPQ